MSLVVRPACPTDAGRLGAILSGFIDDTAWMPRLYSRAEDLAHMGDLIARGWVSVAESAPYSSRYLARQADAADAGVMPRVEGFLAREGADIHALYICARARQRGIGSCLIRHAQETSAELSLWTFVANRPAQTFYRKHGFVETKRTDGMRNEEGLPDIFYEWRRPA